MILYLSRGFTPLAKSTIKYDNCDQENKQRPFDCVNSYLETKFKCSAPWKNCTSLESYGETYRKILRGDTSSLLDFNCNLEMDCKRYIWKMEKSYNQDYDGTSSVFLLQFGQQVIKFKL